MLKRAIAVNCPNAVRCGGFSSSQFETAEVLGTVRDAQAAQSRRPP